MAKSKDEPTYGISTSTKLGKHVKWENYIVPENVTVFLNGGGDIEGRKWPDMSLGFTIREGAAVCIDFQVKSKPGDRPVRTQDLTFIDVDVLARLAFMQHAEKQVNDNHYVNVNEFDEALDKKLRKSVEAGYGQPISELKQVARIYCDPKFRKAPAYNVFQVLGYGSLETAHRRIRAARAKGFIPPKQSSNEQLDAQYKLLNSELGIEND